MLSPKRRLWEFDGPIICRLLGLAFDEEQLNKVIRKLKPKDSQGPSTFPEKHGALVQTCAKPNEVSRYVEKVLERKFEPYGKLVEGIDQKELCQLIEGERGINGLKNVPLPALVWFAVRYQHEGIKEIEPRVFNALHVREHQSLRFYDALSRELPDGKVENVLRELKGVLRSNEDLQKRYERSEQKRARLKLEVEEIKKEKSQVALALMEQKQLSEKLMKNLERLGGQSALDQIESLKKDVDILNQEIKNLTQELVKQELYGAVDIADEPAIKTVCHSEFPLLSLRAKRSNLRDDIAEEQEVPLSLEGKKVAFVGGLESLLPHYRQVVESLGGVFCNYHEECRGRREAEELVCSADVVFCPIDMNSHGCCRCIKRACKLTGKPCCFLHNSSLSTFAKELVVFARSLN
jgi:Uncharacterized protein conserved in bacteria (DUF2325).